MRHGKESKKKKKRGACTVILTDYITGRERDERESFKLNKKKTIFWGMTVLKTEKRLHLRADDEKNTK